MEGMKELYGANKNAAETAFPIVKLLSFAGKKRHACIKIT